MSTITWPYPQVLNYSVAATALPALPSGWQWLVVRSLGDELIAFGASGGQWVTAKLTALDGAWALGTPIAGSLDVTRGLARGNGYYLTRTSDTGLARSADGLAWSAIAPDWATGGGIHHFSQPSFVDGYFYAQDNWQSPAWMTRLVRSLDGVSWTELDSETATNFGGIVDGPPMPLDGDLQLPQQITFDGVTLPWGRYNASSGLLRDMLQDPDSSGFSHGLVWSAALVDGGFVGMGVSKDGLQKGYLVRGFATPPAAFGAVQSAPSGYRGAAYGAGYGVQVESTGTVCGPYDAETNVFFEVAVDTPAVLASVAGSYSHDVVGPFGSTPLLAVHDAVDDSAQLYALDIAAPEEPADIAVSALPVTIPGVVASSVFASGLYSEQISSVLGRTILRRGAAVFVVTPPPGTKSIVMEFGAGTDPSIYCDIFAGQGMDYDALCENYGAPFYGWLSAPDGLVHVIPISGTEPLTIVVQAYDAVPETGGMDITLSARSFWTGFSGCREV